MKKKLDTYLIYLIYIFEFIYTISSLYLNGHAISISEMIKKMSIFDNIFQIAYCMIFIVGILYVLFLLYKIGQHKIIDLKKNTGLLFSIHFMYLALSRCFIIPMLIVSPAMKVVCICFLVHLLIYIKNRKIYILGR